MRAAPLIRDIRHAARSLRRRRGTTLIVTLTLALGIGSAAAVFSVFSELVLEPLPFGDVDRLVRLRETVRGADGTERLVVASGRSLEYWRAHARSFSDMSAARFQSFNLTGIDEAERLVGVRSTWNHFRVLGVEPVLGRGFGPDDDARGTPAPVAVLSHGLWTSRFGRDAGILGNTIELNGRLHTVIGIMPAGFRYPYSAELWVPLGLAPGSEEYENNRLNVSARLAPGATISGAREEMSVLASTLARDRPDEYRDIGFHVRSIREEVLEGIDSQVAAVLAGAVFVLLIGGANVASLLLARFHGRRRELAIRSALGADRAVLVRQVLSEAVLLAIPGCILGLVLAAWAAPLLAGMSPVDDLGPWFQDISVDGRVIGFAAAAALLVALAAGLPAALRATGRSSGSALARDRSGGPTAGERRLWDGLVVGEISMAVLLLTGAGLVGKSLVEVWRSDPGMDLARLVSFSFAPSTAGFAEPGSRYDLVTALLDHVRALPDVRGAAVTNFNPYRDQGWGARVWPAGREAVVPDERITVNHRAVTPGWFETTGTRLLFGRGFVASDDAGAPGVVVVSERLARRLWPGESAVGRRVRRGGPDDEGPWLTVVGVAEEVADYGDLTETWYLPLAQSPEEFPTQILELFVRARGEGSSMVPAVRRAFARLDPDLPVFDVVNVLDVLSFERRVRGFAAFLLGAFAIVGLLLAAAGVYGMLSYAVSRRSREMGVRMALGADPGRILRHVAGQAGRVAVLGVTLGLLALLLLLRPLGSLLTGVDLSAPEVFGGAVAVILLAAGMAAYLPARRATLFDPSRLMTDE